MIKIGDKVYKYKKDALNHYKSILNSYKFGDSLNEVDFNDLMDLLDYDCFFNNENIGGSDRGIHIIDVKIAKVQFGARCFEVMYSNDTSLYISYILMVNQPKENPESLFSIACRSAIQKDIRDVKKKYFYHNSVKGLVKCQETNKLSKWEELAVDHRQPNTFSVIVDRFKEVTKIDISKIEFYVNEENTLVFKNEILSKEFRNYHKEKANLRIVRKECNLIRTGMARIKRTNNDLTIK